MKNGVAQRNLKNAKISYKKIEEYLILHRAFL